MPGFDLKKFRNTDFERRVKEVPVPELAFFFEKSKKSKSKKKEIPVWRCQNMTGEELYRMRDAVDRNRDVEKTLEALAAGQGAEVAKEALGVTDNVPDDLARRLSVLVFGTVNDDGETFSRSDAIALAKEFSVTFDRLTTEIMILSGIGSKPGESNGSGTTSK
jgi:hypothetical protein